MAKIQIVLKDSVHPIEIETSGVAATRILNRYTLFMQNGKQASYKFPLDPPMAGFLSVSFENVLVVVLQTD
jgi:hypothetical protein